MSLLQNENIIRMEGTANSMVFRNGKWALADAEGNPLTDFLYDKIAPLGEDYFKAGVYVKPNDGSLIVEYLDTRMVYAIIDKTGKTHVGLDKGYNYISDFYEGECTVAKNGRCGIIDFDGNVIIACKYKYVQPLGEGHYLLLSDDPDNRYAIIIDKNGNVLIPSDMQYRSIGEFHKGVAIASHSTTEGLRWGLIDDRGRCMANLNYQYIQYWSDGYYLVERGAKKNLVNQKGELVLNEWFNDIYEIHHGFFIFGNTIRKTKTTPTRYVRGVASVQGDIVFPMIFEKVRWSEDYSYICAELGTTPYILTLDGSIYDPAGSHLPQKLEINDKTFLENTLNWVLPGLQFFYRDTDAISNAKQIYHKGQTLRAGFYVDATTKLLKPLHRTRFIIASAHAARLFEIDKYIEANSNVGKWNLAIFHYNSYFKVMDVYETPTCTQVFLLHLPMSAALLLGDTDFNFIDKASGTEKTLTQLARQSLDEKLTMDYHPRSFDEDLCQRMKAPVGLDNSLTPFPLSAEPEPTDQNEAAFSNMIHEIAQDEDINYKVEVKDNFDWTGPESTVCEGCIYTRGIPKDASGCGRLFKKSFRERVVKGYCEFRKTDLFIPSEFEERRKRETIEACEKAEKQSDVFAISLLREFVKEKLDGNIDKLRTYDLYSLRNDEKYGNSDFARANIVKAIVALAFADVWPGLSVQSIEEYKYWVDAISDNTRLLGARILDMYYKGLESWDAPKELQQRALDCGKLFYSVGDLIVWPNKMNDYKEAFDSYYDGTKYKGYMDQYLNAIYCAMTGQARPDFHMQGLLYKNRKVMTAYKGYDGFKRLVDNLFLTDFVDEEYQPKHIFAGVWSYMKGLDQQTYFKAVDEYIDFCNAFIPKRADKIIMKLKRLLDN